MSASNRSSLIAKTYKVLKKYYDPISPPADRTVLDHLLYACCLENASPEAADEAFARLQQAFFDWNEIRVTTVTELAETMSSLPDAAAAATRLKRVLQHVFEARYSYDIEALKKQNLGRAAKELEGIRGVTQFGVAYVTQHGLGGHAIPVSEGIVGVLQVIGIASETEARKQRVPGLERAITKSKGIEFASLLHQLGAEFYCSPHGANVKTIVLEIAPDAKERLPKRAAKAGIAKQAAEPEQPTEPGQPPKSEQPPKPEQPPKSRAKRKTAGRKSAEAPKKRTKKAAEADTPATQKGEDEEKDAAKSSSAGKRSPTKQLTRKKPR
jgi:endonuclease III